MASAEKTLLDGKIEMDETYIGGKKKGQVFTLARKPRFQ